MQLNLPKNEEPIDRPRPHLTYRRPASRAEDLLLVLLQVDDPITIAAASSLLQHRWEGHQQLVTYLRELATTWDDETRGVWSDTLGMRLSPER